MKNHFFATSTITSLLTFGSLSLASAALPFNVDQVTDSATKVAYSISTDGAKTEKQKTIQLATTSTTDEAKSKVTNTQTTALRTGSAKTVGQTLELLTGVFQKFLANPAPGAVLGELGSLEKGGAVEFVAVSPDVLCFNFKSASGVSPTNFSQADVKNFLALLTK